ncbi:DUF5693 family protein [Halanaerobacter jeridensis]|uniref:Uncharacterized protein n=1 Tax=Halanaerobacter jeridensis TaxID=706427 RepID=A0A938XT73_9FIRM|nr:DUF5693 family protein [Halanaerobacter jeridensis]MBM7557296.1 hypothetical protein [Halanaerobacter jeridensis]
MLKIKSLILVLILIVNSVILIDKDKIESSNRQVELTADYELFNEFEQLNLLTKFSEQGLSSLAVGEESLRELARENKISIESAWGFKGASAAQDEINSNQIYISGPPAILGQVVKRWRKLNDLEYDKEKNRLIIPQSRSELLTKPVYFASRALSLSQRTNLNLIPRFKADSSYQELSSVAASLKDLTTIIFSGQEVVGYADNLIQTAKKLEELDLKLGLIEPFLAPQRGAKELAAQMSYQALRVHSIKQRELEQLGVQAAVNRYFKAVQQRNVRLLYLKPFANEVQTSQFITSLQEKLSEANYDLAVAQPFEKAKDYQQLKVGLILLLLLLTCLYLKEFNTKLAVISLVSGLSLILIFYLLAWSALIVLVSLLIAVIVPWLEYIYLLSTIRERSLKEVYLTFLAITLISITAGLVITALLFDNSYLLQIKEFRGVKVAFALPLLLGAGYYLGQESKTKDIKEEIEIFLAEPVSWRQLLLLSSALVLGVFYLGRTGNQFFIGVSSIEVLIRKYLAEFFVVRPRFKSFLIGHPLLLLGLFRGPKKYYQWLLLGGLIGQINIINTLVHLHMPLKISLLRVVIGVAMQLAIIPVYRLNILTSKGVEQD